MAITKSFEKWKTQEVEEVFGIVYKKQITSLNNWLAASYKPSEIENIMLNRLKDKLLDYIECYNEADISMFFISHVITLVDFVQERYRAYNQLPLKQKVKDINGNELELGGIAEMVVARGRQIPQTPYFFLNEYKPEKRTGSESDPKGQLLIAMIAAQAKNNDEFPIYGCYINGRNWHFVILEGKNYAVSNAYNATDNDIFQIYSILMEMKRYIHLRLNLPFPINES